MKSLRQSLVNHGREELYVEIERLRDRVGAVRQLCQKSGGLVYASEILDVLDSQEINNDRYVVVQK